MADIDMIPRSYRDGLRVQRALRGYGLALGAVLLAGAIGTGALHWRLAVETPQLNQLRTRTAQAEALRTQLATATVRKSVLEQDARALAALRASGSVASLTQALDGALNDKVWFASLHLSSTAELLRAPLPSPLPSGTIETRASNQPNAAPGPQTWRLARHVEISGQAQDHAALTAFLSTLSANPVLTDVRFLRSTAAPGEGPELVAFSVSAMLDRKTP
jgi:Tfp pilus assembly protein PilN